MKRTGKSFARWRVTVIGGAKAREICELEAQSAEAPIKRAIRGTKLTIRTGRRD
jgi:hypothetical protein